MLRSPGESIQRSAPIFFAGGVVSQADVLQAGKGGNHKAALTRTYFSTDHFSSSLADMEDPMLKRTRVTVKLLEGKNLLVSDLPTGTSDPVALVWVGSTDEGSIDLQKDIRVQSTEVRKKTVDPVWDADFVFPLEVQTVDDVLNGQINIVVRDHDDADGDVHYLDLGRVSVSLETVLTEGNIMAHTQLVQLPARWFALQRCRGMKRSRGAIKVAIGFFVGADSSLLQVGLDEDIDQGEEVAARFEHNMRKIRGEEGTIDCRRAVSMSPTRQSSYTTKETLTARGGTTARRPKSAPQATILYSSPSLARQRPFKLKPLIPRSPPEGGQHTSTTPLDASRWEAADDDQTSTPTEAIEALPWRDMRGTLPEHQPRTPPVLARNCSGSIGVGLRRTNPLTEWTMTYPSATQSVRPSSKLSRLAAKAASGSNQGPPNVSPNNRHNGEEGATLRAHLWHRALLESMQRLEDRSTEIMAYGELRARAREASPLQVGQVVAAARRVGTGCSLAARRYTLRLLAWLCWDQPRASGKFIGGIVSYVLDRARDDETASLRHDLAVCVGAVMLSALRRSTADANMVQMRRFLEIVGDQRTPVRESAGACCVASILPKLPGVPVEFATGFRSIDDVRITIDQAAERVGITIAVPKQVVLLPEGRVIVELPDTPTAADFFFRLSSVVEVLPLTWSIFPFPEDFCAEAERAAAAHFVRLTINSEEILASLLEALDHKRTEGTRGQILSAVAAMAQSLGDNVELENTNGGVSATNGLGGGMSTTLRKGLPVVGRAVATIMECTARGAYTWKERRAALEVVIAFAALQDLRGADGRPLGEHRARLIQGSLRGKRDSVAAVRETALGALAALEASETEHSCWRKTPDATSTGFYNLGTARSFGAGMGGANMGKRNLKGGSNNARNKHNLDEIVAKAEGATVKEETPSAAAKLAGKDGDDYYRDVSQGTHAKSYARARGDVDAAGSSPNVLLEKWRGIPSLRSRPGTRRTGVIGAKQSPSQEAEDAPVDTYTKSSEDEELADRDPREPDVGDRGGSPIAHAADPADPREGNNVISVLPLAAKAEVRHVSVQTIDTSRSPPFETAILTGRGITPMPLVPVEAAVSLSPPPPTRERVQDGNTRLLQRLHDKTDGITIALNSLDQRLVDMEKHITEPIRTVNSPSHSSSPKLERRPHSVPAPGLGNAAEKSPIFGDKVATADIPRDATGAQALTHLRRELKGMVKRGDIEEAFRLVLTSGSERDILRVMGTAGELGTCQRRLGMETRDRLFVFIARTISSGRYNEHVLPWVFELVKAGEARALPLEVRMQLAGSLHGLAAKPTDQGVMAARLRPYLSLASVGRTSESKAAERGDVFSSTGI